MSNHHKIANLLEKEIRVLSNLIGDQMPQIMIAMTAVNNEFYNLKLCLEEPVRPLDLILKCPECGERHIDEGEFADKVHHTHACQHCGSVWRPAVEPTRGVQFLRGFKNV